MNPEEEVQKLKEKIRELEEALEQKEEKYKKLKKEFDEFQAKHAVTVSNLQEALKIKANLPRHLKQPGLKKGHNPHFRPSPVPDEEKTLKLDCCPHCKTRLVSRVQEWRSRIVTDILLGLKAKNTKYTIPRKYCPCCEKLVEPQVPNALPHARLGLNLMLLVMYLKLGLRLPCEKICDFLSTTYDVSISEGGIIVVLKQLVNAFGPYYGLLEKAVKMARVKNADSTSWRVSGRNYFAWVFIASGVVLYKVRLRNNHKVGLSLFGTDQKGKVLCVDRHSAFRTLAEKAGFVLQLCWAHILRDSKDLAESFGAEGKYVHEKLKEIYALAKGLNHKGSIEQVQQLQGIVFELTQRHYKHSTMRRFVNALFYRDIENLFRFVTDPEIASTNNISERELRHLVLMRKISNGSRSQRGAAATAILTSIVQTLRFRKENVLLGLQQILKNPSGY